MCKQANDTAKVFKICISTLRISSNPTWIQAAYCNTPRNCKMSSNDGKKYTNSKKHKSGAYKHQKKPLVTPEIA